MVTPLPAWSSQRSGTRSPAFWSEKPIFAWVPSQYGLFFEAPQTEEELARVGSELAEYRLMANMVEFGKTPLLPAERLGELGFSLIIYPGAITRTVVPAARAVLNELKSAGSTAGWLDHMASFQDVNEVLDLSEINAWETHIADRARGAASS